MVSLLIIRTRKRRARCFCACLLEGEEDSKCRRVWRMKAAMSVFSSSEGGIGKPRGRSLRNPSTHRIRTGCSRRKMFVLFDSWSRIPAHARLLALSKTRERRRAPRFQIHGTYAETSILILCALHALESLKVYTGSSSRPCGIVASNHFAQRNAWGTLASKACPYICKLRVQRENQHRAKPTPYRQPTATCFFVWWPNLFLRR